MAKSILECSVAFMVFTVSFIKQSEFNNYIIGNIMSLDLKALVILNAFSLNMLENLDRINDIVIQPVDPQEVLGLYPDYTSAVGHQDTASVFQTVLGVDVPMNRTSIVLDTSTILLVGQYKGERLPEGATTLPEGSTIQWVTVELL